LNSPQRNRTTDIRVTQFLGAVILFFIVFFGWQDSNAQNAVWVGGVSNSWHTAANWSPAVLPTAGSTVKIRPQGTNPYPVITSNVTVTRVELSEWSSGGDLTIESGATLTVSTRFDINNEGRLFVNNGTVQMNGNGSGQNRFNLGFTNVLVEVGANGQLNSPNAAFTLNGTMNIVGGGANLGSGLTVADSKNLNITTGTLQVTGNVSVFGNLNGGEGTLSFGGTGSNSVVIRNGGRFYMAPFSSTSTPDPVCPTGTPSNPPLNGGSVNFNIEASIENNGGLYAGDALIVFHQSATSQGNAITSVRNGQIEYLGNVTMSNTASLEITCRGTIIISGNGTFQQNGNISLGSGNLIIEGNATFQNTGTMNAGDATITFGGDVTIANSGGTINAENSTIFFEGSTFNNSGTFNAGESTFVFAGDGTQSITGSNSDIVFFNLEVEEGAAVTSQQNVTVLNSMAVEDGADYENTNNTTLNVVGAVVGDPQIFGEAPYIVSIEIINSTTIMVIFSRPLTVGPATTASNYKVRLSLDGTFATDTFNLPTNPVLSNGNQNVTLTLGYTIVTGTNYYLWVQNLTEAQNNTPIGVPHRKLFRELPPPVFYSRTSGDWNQASSWSADSHTGAAFTRAPGQGGDQVIVGNGHTITVNSSVSLAPLASITVASGSALRVSSDGFLNLATKVVEGAGTFEVQSGGGISIASPQGIAASGASGNVQTATRIFSTEGNYTYNASAAQSTGTGLPGTVNNLTTNTSAGLTLTNNVRVDGTLTLEAGDFTIPSGGSIVAPTQVYVGGQFRALREIMIPATDTPGGWRTYSSPLRATYGNLFSELTTQGFTGSSLGTTFSGNPLSPSVLWYEESYYDTVDGFSTANMRWRMPSNAADSVVAGRGLFTYVFGNITTDTRYNQTSAVLDVTGRENQGISGEVDFGVTFTAEADSGWNLVGNPFLATIDWDAVAGWTKTNMSPSIYVWDEASAEYLTWNGVTGSLGNGYIKPFQGFWVKASAASPELAVNQDAKTTTTSGTFYSREVQEDIPIIELVFASGPLTSRAHIMFSDDARSSIDAYDAFRLRSLAPTYLESFTVTPSGDRLAINNMPRRFSRPVEIPVDVDAMQLNAGFNNLATVAFGELRGIPSHWRVELIDRATGEVVIPADRSTVIHPFLLRTQTRRDDPLRREVRYAEGQPQHTGARRAAAQIRNNRNDAIEVSNPQTREAYSAAQNTPNLTLDIGPTQPEAKLEQVHADDTRFVLRITPTEIDPEIPEDFGLGQNYPNPFNPTTRIPFELATDGVVTLEIYDITGRRVATLLNEYRSAGRHQVTWNATNLASGVYLYRLTTPESAFTRKLTLIK
jgi:hypothetical protein